MVDIQTRSSRHDVVNIEMEGALKDGKSDENYDDNIEPEAHNHSVPASSNEGRKIINSPFDMWPFIAKQPLRLNQVLDDITSDPDVDVREPAFRGRALSILVVYAAQGLKFTMNSSSHDVSFPAAEIWEAMSTSMLQGVVGLDELVLRRKITSSSSTGQVGHRLSAEELRLPTIGADVVWTVASDNSSEELCTDQYILAFAPRAGSGDIHRTAAAAYANLCEDVWLFQVTCGWPDFQELLMNLGCAGAIRWDFESAYAIHESLPPPLSHVAHGLAVAHDESQRMLLRFTSSLHHNLFPEITLLVRFSEHPNIIRFYGSFCRDVGAQSDCCRAVLSFEQHPRTLDAEMDTGISQEMIGGVMFSVLSALCHIHEHRVAHRDVRPHVVLVGTERRVVLAGFRHAACIDDRDAMNNFVGKPGYVAPEIVRKQAYGLKADVFSAGVMFYLALTGTHPFGGQETSSKKVIFRTQLKNNEEMPESVQFLVQGMLSEDSKLRPTSAEALERLERGSCSSTASKTQHLEEENWTPASESEDEGIAWLPNVDARRMSSQSVLELRAALPSLSAILEEPCERSSPLEAGTLRSSLRQAETILQPKQELDDMPVLDPAETLLQPKQEFHDRFCGLLDAVEESSPPSESRSGEWAKSADGDFKPPARDRVKAGPVHSSDEAGPQRRGAHERLLDLLEPVAQSSPASEDRACEWAKSADGDVKPPARDPLKASSVHSSDEAGPQRCGAHEGFLDLLDPVEQSSPASENRACDEAKSADGGVADVQPPARDRRKASPVHSSDGERPGPFDNRRKGSESRVLRYVAGAMRMAKKTGSELLQSLKKQEALPHSSCSSDGTSDGPRPLVPERPNESPPAGRRVWRKFKMSASSIRSDG